MSKARLQRCVSFLVFTVVLSGCLLKPEYERPVVLDDAPYRDAQEAGAIVNMKWWELFKDPQLKQLITTALAENRDLQVAMARIDEARALLGVVRPDQFPRLDYSGAMSRTDASQAGVMAAPPINDFSLLGNLNYEVDLWGRYASATEAQRAELVSLEEAYKSVTLSLVAQVAITYLQLLDIDRQILISERTLKNRHSNTQLILERFKGGYTAKIDLNQAQIQEQDAAAALVAQKRAKRLAENAMSVLLGHVPHEIPRAKPNSDPLAIHEIPVGVPADLLSRRPDVRAAEEKARAAVMRVGIARATQFPSINLFGILGLNSDKSTELFTADGRLWSVGGSMVGPLIDLGKSWSRTDAAEAQAEQALKSYEAVVLQAVREVEDARVAVHTLYEEHRIREIQVAAAQSANMLSRRRYDDGVTSYLEVLNTETSLFTSDLSRSNTLQRYLSGLVQLYKALGGGWELPEQSQAAVK
jgi:multidrug efflux system outer membrane protein